MKKPARYLGLVLCGGLLWTPRSAPASGLDDLTNAAGQGLPNVPMPPEPTRDDDSNTNQGNSDSQNDEHERQETLRQQRAEQERQRQAEQERREKAEQARQEMLRQQEAERQRQETLHRQAAAAAHVQWAADDEKNDTAFSDIFNSSPGAGAAANDSNVVDLTDATSLVPTLLRGGAPKVSLRVKPPPMPAPEITLGPGSDEPELPPPPQWHPDWKGKFTDLGFAYASTYLKSKVEGLASIPELAKDSLDLKEKLSGHITAYLDMLLPRRIRRRIPMPIMRPWPPGRGTTSRLPPPTWTRMPTTASGTTLRPPRAARCRKASTPPRSESAWARPSCRISKS